MLQLSIINENELNTKLEIINEHIVNAITDKIDGVTEENIQASGHNLETTLDKNLREIVQQLDNNQDGRYLASLHTLSLERKQDLLFILLLHGFNNTAKLLYEAIYHYNGAYFYPNSSNLHTLALNEKAIEDFSLPIMAHQNNISDVFLYMITDRTRELSSSASFLIKSNELSSVILMNLRNRKEDFSSLLLTAYQQDVSVPLPINLFEAYLPPFPNLPALLKEKKIKTYKQTLRNIDVAYPVILEIFRTPEAAKDLCNYLGGVPQYASSIMDLLGEKNDARDSIPILQEALNNSSISDSVLSLIKTSPAYARALLQHPYLLKSILLNCEAPEKIYLSLLKHSGSELSLSDDNQLVDRETFLIFLSAASQLQAIADIMKDTAFAFHITHILKILLQNNQTFMEHLTSEEENSDLLADLINKTPKIAQAILSDQPLCFRLVNSSNTKGTIKIIEALGTDRTLKNRTIHFSRLIILHLRKQFNPIIIQALFNTLSSEDNAQAIITFLSQNPAHQPRDYYKIILSIAKNYEAIFLALCKEESFVNYFVSLLATPALLNENDKRKIIEIILNSEKSFSLFIIHIAKHPSIIEAIGNDSTLAIISTKQPFSDTLYNKITEQHTGNYINNYLMSFLYTTLKSTNPNQVQINAILKRLSEEEIIDFLLKYKGLPLENTLLIFKYIHDNYKDNCTIEKLYTKLSNKLFILEENKISYRGSNTLTKIFQDYAFLDLQGNENLQNWLKDNKINIISLSITYTMLNELTEAPKSLFQKIRPRKNSTAQLNSLATAFNKLLKIYEYAVATRNGEYQKQIKNQKLLSFMNSTNFSNYLDTWENEQFWSHLLDFIEKIATFSTKDATFEENLFIQYLAKGNKQVIDSIDELKKLTHLSNTEYKLPTSNHYQNMHSKSDIQAVLRDLLSTADQEKRNMFITHLNSLSSSELNRNVEPIEGNMLALRK